MTPTDPQYTAGYSRGWEDARLALAMKYEEELRALREVAEKAREVADWQCDHNAGHEDQNWYPPGPPCEDCKQLRAALASLDAVRKAGER